MVVPYTRPVDTTTSDPIVGRLVDDRYEVQQRVAHGGMATVYRALDTRLDRVVALKVMHAHLAADPGFASRFSQEARAAAKLSHPNVVAVFDQGQVGGLTYLTMEFLEGQTLRQALSSRGALTVREMLAVAQPIVDGLAAAHRAGIVHRDVKPENVILVGTGQVKVADFGLARAMTTDQTGGPSLGTAAYMAPELVAQGASSPASDVYALGILLFELLTGAQPFTGDAPMQIAVRHLNERVPAPSTLVPSLPPEVDALVLACTDPDPARRVPSAVVLADRLAALRGVLASEVIDLRPATAPTVVTPSSTEVFNPVNSTQVMPPSSDVVAAAAVSRRARRAAEQAPAPSAVSVRPPRPPADPYAGGRDPYADLRRRRLLALLGGVLAVALVLGAGLWWFSSGPGAVVTLPDVTGTAADDAQVTLEALQLEVTTKTVHDDEVEDGDVVSSQPASGTQVQKGSTVVLLVSDGPETVKVPRTSGRTVEEARSTLEENHLTVADGTSTAYSDTVDEGKVVGTNPAAGKSVSNGTEVTVIVSKGPKPVTVPNVVGATQADAQATLEALGLKVQTSTQNSDTVPSGSVISQDPAADSESSEGATVNLVISQGPSVVTVPDVTNKSLSEATAILEQLGLTVKTQSFGGGWGDDDDGTVRFQNPAANSQVQPGTEITLTVF